MSGDLITVGKVTGHYGVKGWVKVFSYTQPMENISNYSTWIVGGKTIKGIKSKRHGKTIVAYFKGLDNREKSQILIGNDIQINRSELSDLQDGEYYWYQLIGLDVFNSQDQHLGVIDSMFETGANDVMVIKNAAGAEILVPYVDGQYVLNVALKERKVTVDWSLDEE